MRLILFLLTGLFFCGQSSVYAALSKPIINTADGQTNVPQSFSVNTKKVSSATYYLVQLSENAGMSNAMTDTGEVSFYSVQYRFNELKLNTTYYWRIRAYSATDSSSWTDVQTFTTHPKLLFYTPNSGTTSLGPYVYYSWYNVAEYDSFEFVLDTVNTFNSAILYREIVPDTFSNFWLEIYYKDMRLSANYFWRVRGFKGSDTSAWSDLNYGSSLSNYNFTKPVDGGTYECDVPIYFGGVNVWPFQVQADTSPNFDSPIIFDSLHTTGGISELTLHDLQYDETYYVRMRAVTAHDTANWITRTVMMRGFKGKTMYAAANANPRTELQGSTSIDGTLGYIFEVDTTDQFNSHHFWTTTDSTYRTFIDSLYFGTTYFARSRPFNSRDTGDWSLVRGFYTKDVPQLYYPFQSTKDVGIRDSLTWSNSLQGVHGFHLQVVEGTDFNNSLLADTFLPVSSNQFKGLVFKFNTTYSRRIRMFHSQDTSDWSASNDRIFTTIASTTLKKPYDSDFLGETPQTWLIWNTIKTVPKYEVWLDTSVDFNSPQFQKFIVGNDSLQVNDLLFGGLYRWKVRAINGTDTSLWSDTWKFWIINPPRPDYPKNKGTNITVTSVDWRSLNGTKGYIVELDTSSSFADPWVLADTVSNPFFHWFDPFPLEEWYDMTFYWRVKVYHSKDTSDWSDVWSFSTRPRQSPGLIYPADSSEKIPFGLTFNWSALSGAAGYVLQYTEDPTFKSAGVLTTSGTTISALLKPGTRYYWRVRGRNSQGQDIGEWSYIFTFVTDDQLETPILLSPVDGFINAPVTINLKWTEVNQATYEIDLSTDSTFATTDRKSASAANKTYTNLDGRTTYFWRVRAKAQTLTSDWSPVWKFTTGRGAGISTKQLQQIVVVNSPTNWQISLCSDCREGDYELRDMNGKILQSGTIVGPELLLDHSELASGMYLLSISVEGNQVVRKLYR
ncbi:MAG: hypothetical protein H6608_02730 [Flavobacteriales bacterium]|nr:hypothetical protein [Bacteroidota bacterium]MCB9240022.1 hypothetical protein [Flavobacteriales bacterium]